MVRGHPLLSLQIKGILKDIEVKRDLKKSRHLHIEMLHSLTERKERSSGHTGEVLVLRQKVPMGHHSTTNPLLVTISWHLEEVLLIAARNFLPLPHITTEMLIHMDPMVCQNLPVLIPATKGNVPLPVQRTGAGHQVMADTALMSKESLGPVHMQAVGDQEVPTGSLLAQAQMSDVLPGPAVGVHIPPPDIHGHEVATVTLVLEVVHPAFHQAH